MKATKSFVGELRGAINAYFASQTRTTLGWLTS